MYKLYIPNQLGGTIHMKGKTYEVKNHELETDDLHDANFMVEHLGCTLYGGDAIKMAKSVIVKRGRGLGDVLMMTPLMRKLKQQMPEVKITYACDFIFLELLKYLPYIDRIVTIPQLGYHINTCWVTESDGSRTMHDYWINCDGVAENVENHKKISTMHRVDLFGEMAGLSFAEEERRLDYVVTEEEEAWAKKKLSEMGIQKGDKVLGMTVRATCFNRTMPHEKFRKIASLAVQDGWKVIIFDHDAAFGWEDTNILNVAGKTSIREFGALISQCNMFFGPDSGGWHLACALNIPNVAYFGAMNWKLRVTMPKSRIIAKNVQCYPCDRYDCHWHTKLACIDFSPEKCYEVIKESYSELNEAHPIFEKGKELTLVH